MIDAHCKVNMLFHQTYIVKNIFKGWHKSLPKAMVAT